jgi:hypothetical protein
MSFSREIAYQLSAFRRRAQAAATCQIALAVFLQYVKLVTFLAVWIALA